MHLARRCFVAVLVATLGACGGPPATSRPLGDGIQALKDGLAAVVMPPADGTDLLVARLMTAVDLRGALGAQADVILALGGKADIGAYAQLPHAVPATSRAGSTSAVRSAAYFPEIPLPPRAPPPTSDLMQTFPGSLDAVGRPGPGTARSGPDTATASERGDGFTAMATMTSTTDIAITGSAVQLDISRSVHSTVADDTSGAIALDATETYTVRGKMDVCPTSAGISIASLDQTIAVDATTKPGALGRVGTHSIANIKSSSNFRGQVDDAATLGGVSQDYTHDEQWRRTAAAEGGPEAKREGTIHVNLNGIGAGVPTAHGFSPGIGNFSKVDGSVKATGDFTQAMIDSTAISAAWDFATIDQAFVAAQKLWRNSRCVMLAVPQYDTANAPAESPVDVTVQGSPVHTEDVEKASATPFEVVLRHRFGQSVTSAVEAKLNGKADLTPTSIEKPPGTLTYTAPNEDKQKASVRMTSTSKQGIGILVIEFATKGGTGLAGSVTVVEDWQDGTDWSKRSLTVNVRLKPAVGYDGITGLFEDDGSSYTYAGSSFSHVENGSDASCFMDRTKTSTGSGAFGSTGRVISLGIDASPGDASLIIDVEYTTTTVGTTTCLGNTQTTSSSDDHDGWVSPVCGLNAGSYLNGTVDQNGKIDFTCSASSGAGTRSLTVSGSLSRR